MATQFVGYSRLALRSQQQASKEASMANPPLGRVPQIPLILPDASPVAQVQQVVVPTEGDTLNGLSASSPETQFSGADTTDPRKRRGSKEGIAIGGMQGGVGIRL